MIDKKNVVDCIILFFIEPLKIKELATVKETYLIIGIKKVKLVPNCNTNILILNKKNDNTDRLKVNIVLIENKLCIKSKKKNDSQI